MQHCMAITIELKAQELQNIVSALQAVPVSRQLIVAGTHLGDPRHDRATCGPSGNEAKCPHLRLLTQTVREVVFPVLATADHQAKFRAAEGRRSDDDIGYLVILPAGNRQEVVPLPKPPLGGVRFFRPISQQAIERIAEVFHVYLGTASPFLRAQLHKLPHHVDDEEPFRVHRLPPFRPDLRRLRQPKD